MGIIYAQFVVPMSQPAMVHPVRVTMKATNDQSNQDEQPELQLPDQMPSMSKSSDRGHENVVALHRLCLFDS